MLKFLLQDLELEMQKSRLVEKNIVQGLVRWTEEMIQIKINKCVELENKTYSVLALESLCNYQFDTPYRDFCEGGAKNIKWAWPSGNFKHFALYFSNYIY